MPFHFIAFHSARKARAESQGKAPHKNKNSSQSFRPYFRFSFFVFLFIDAFALGRHLSIFAKAGKRALLRKPIAAVVFTDDG